VNYSMKRSLILVALAAFILIAQGCGTNAVIQRPSPAAYNLGASKSLVMVQMSGKRSLREQLMESLSVKARQSNWWQFEDKMSKGIEIVPKGDSASARPTGPKDGEVFVRVDVYEADANKDQVVEQFKNSKGQTITKRSNVFVGAASIGVTTLDASGRARLSEKEYSGEAKIPENKGDKDAAKQAAIDNAVSKFLADITPRFINESVKVDDESKDLGPVVEIIKKRSYAQAADKLESMMASQPNRPDVVYNLAVMHDAMANYDKALTLYDKAINLGGKGFYATTRAACTNRLAEYKALSK